MKKKKDFFASFVILENIIERMENFNIIDIIKLIKIDLLMSFGEKKRGFLRFISYPFNSLGEYN